MMKLRISAIITALLGIVSLAWIIYDYIMIAAYSSQENPFGDWKMVSLGFVPIILFHFSFFITVYILFDFLKNHKAILKENNKLRSEIEQLKLKPRTEELKAKQDNYISYDKNKSLDRYKDEKKKDSDTSEDIDKDDDYDNNPNT